ncbi:hypothetical protein [Kribbella capetownensis]|nr:hypothetical protein [Kribbella capetownensis]
MERSDAAETRERGDRRSLFDLLLLVLLENAARRAEEASIGLEGRH